MAPLPPLPVPNPFLLPKDEILPRASDSDVAMRILVDGGLVGSMEFLKVKYQSQTVVGRVVSINEKRDVPRNEMNQRYGRPKDKHLLIQFYRPPPPRTRRPHHIQYEFIPDTLEEVVETEELCWVPASSVVTIAFVFHQDDVQARKYTPQGMVDTYFIRSVLKCNKDGTELNKRSSPLSSTDFQPFYNPHPKSGLVSFSHRVYCFIETSKEEVTRSMLGGGNWDGVTKSVTLRGVGEDMFRHCKSKMRHASPKCPEWNPNSKSVS